MIGAIPEHGRTRFRVWAPMRGSVDVHVLSPFDKFVAMERDDLGYFETVVDGTGDGARYLFRLDGDVERPDPASRSQPDGVHGPSEVIEPAKLTGAPMTALHDFVLYELHVGTFTREGTFDAAIGDLDRLRDLGPLSS